MSIIADRAHSSLFTIVDTAGFPGSKSFVSEMSTVSAHFVDPLKQFYDDACDTGFLLVSAKTGVAAGFTLSDCQLDLDNDVVCWVFKPTADAIRRNPKLQHTEARIYNT